MGVRLNGSTSGYVELNAPATAGTTVLELPTDSIKPGMVLVASQSFSAVSSVSVNNCFTATYENYKVFCDFSVSSTPTMTFRFRAAGVDASTGYFTSTNFAVGSSASAIGLGASNMTSSDRGVFSVDILAPMLARESHLVGLSGLNAGYLGACASGALRNTSTYDGFSVIASTGNMTGTIRIYGYRNS
jgi:hypothetical protein